MSDDFDDYFDDDLDASAFDNVIATAVHPDAGARPVASTSRAPAPAQPARYIGGPGGLGASTGGGKGLKQQTLFGGTVPDKPVPSSGRPQGQHGSSSGAPMGTQQPRVATNKRWDRLKFADGLPRTGGARPNGKGKGKGKARASWGNDDEEEDVLDEEDGDDSLLDLRAKQEAVGPPPKMKLRHDPDEIRTWVYSINKPKRKYQYDIVHRSLYNNCLVSLPTGLGKTFIAAVVMLNFYRWYPKGKVIFLAPTRPLVQQQIEACHSIAGIPSKDCVALTGMVPAPRRQLAWASKRVVFSTPQTVENDLRRGRLEPSDVICVVIDEAHRATGGYAYCEVVRLLMQFNPHFRVLALTATPGNDAEKVQNVIDALHIGHIEVRTEDAMDIKPYTKEKKIVLELVKVTGDLADIRDRWANLMRPLISQVDFLLYGTKEPAFLSPFIIQQMQSKVPKDRGWLRPTISLLAKMTHAMARLLEYSIKVGGQKMADLRQETSKAAKALCDKKDFKDLLRDIDQLQKDPTFSAHPKMDKMKALVLEFLMEAKDAGKEPRLMVFCHFRDVVDDIVAFLNQEKPIIRASSFVGQGKDTKGGSGMNQKAQGECIRKFKANEFNVLVATSIGEEGLDIGALDCIICYDAQSSPLRTLQRIGRTGRNDDGRVVVLQAEGREERNWDKAKDKYEHVQNALISRKLFELYDDCESLVPQGIKPKVEEREIPVQQYIATEVEIPEAQKGGGKNGKATKRKRDGLEDLPPNAVKGFTTARDVKPAKTKEESMAERMEAALLPDDQHAEAIEKMRRHETPIHTDSAQITYFATDVLVSRRTNRLLNSRRIESIFEEATTWAEDEAYEQWKSTVGEAFDERLVNWWDDEKKGKGARNPFVPCVDTRNRARRRFRAPLSPPADEHGSEEEAQSSEEDMEFQRHGFEPEAKVSRPQAAPARPAEDRNQSSSPLPDGPPPFKPRQDSTTTIVDDSEAEDEEPLKLPKPTDPFNVLSSDSEEDEADVRPLSKKTKRSQMPDPIESESEVDVPVRMDAAPDVGDSTFDAGDLSGFSEGAFAELDRIEGKASRAAGGKLEGSYEVVVNFDSDDDEVLGPAAVSKKPIFDLTSSSVPRTTKHDVFRKPLLPASVNNHVPAVQHDIDSEGSSPAPLQPIKRRGRPPKVRDSVGDVPAATQMPFARRLKAKGKSVLAADSEDDEVEALEVPGKRPKRLRRAAEEERADEGSKETTKADASKEDGKKRKKGKKHGNDWAKKTGLFEMEASESSGDGSSDVDEGGRTRPRRKKKTKQRSSSPSIPSEDSSDRAFVAGDSSQASPDQSMQRFYRESLMTQPSHGDGPFAEGPKRAGALPWRNRGMAANANGGGVGGRSSRWQDTPPQGPPRSDDQWSMGSFVVSDGQIDWEEGASGAVQEGTSEL